MNKLNFYFGKMPFKADFDLLQGNIEKSINTVKTLLGKGIFSGGEATADGFVIELSPAVLIDQNGRDLSIPETSFNLSSYIPVTGKKILSITAGYKASFAVKEINDYGEEVFYEENDSFEITILESEASDNPVPPVIPADRVLLLDVTLDSSLEDIPPNALDTGRVKKVNLTVMEHYLDVNNPHAVKLSQLKDLILPGDMNANQRAILNLPDPKTSQEPVTLFYAANLLSPRGYMEGFEIEILFDTQMILRGGKIDLNGILYTVGDILLDNPLDGSKGNQWYGIFIDESTKEVSRKLLNTANFPDSECNNWIQGANLKYNQLNLLAVYDVNKFYCSVLGKRLIYVFKYSNFTQNCSVNPNNPFIGTSNAEDIEFHMKVSGTGFPDNSAVIDMNPPSSFVVNYRGTVGGTFPLNFWSLDRIIQIKGKPKTLLMVEKINNSSCPADYFTVPFEWVELDLTSEWNRTTYEFQAKSMKKVIYDLHVSWTAGSTSRNEYLYKNGLAIISHYFTPSFQNNTPLGKIHDLIFLMKNDTLVFRIYNGDTSATIGSGVKGTSRLVIHEI
jgi:hypothetical protein